MIGPSKIKNITRWAVVDFEGNVLSVHFSETQADSAAWELMRNNHFLANKLRTCEVSLTEVN